jgi:hypothetical protein
VSNIRQSVEVAVPVRTAYDQWTQFEEFPRFMAGVESVSQLDATHLRWVADVAGHRAEWEAEITEQIPDARIAWTSTDGRETAGLVMFESLDDERTLVTVDFEYEAEGVAETIGSALGIDDRRVKADLERFRELVEAQGEASGAWRGLVREEGAEVHEPDEGASRPQVPPVDEQPPGPGAEPQRAPAEGTLEADRDPESGLRAGAGPQRGFGARDPSGATGTGLDVDTGAAGLGLEEEDRAARERGV